MYYIVRTFRRMLLTSKALDISEPCMLAHFSSPRFCFALFCSFIFFHFFIFIFILLFWCNYFMDILCCYFNNRSHITHVKRLNQKEDEISFVSIFLPLQKKEKSLLLLWCNLSTYFYVVMLIISLIHITIVKRLDIKRKKKLHA